MNTGGLNKLIKTVRTSMKKNSSQILTGIGIAGMVTTTVMAAKATPKALRLIEEKKAEKNDILTSVETVKAAWTCYIPAAIIGGMSIACLIGASSVNVRRNAALATAYALSESTLKEYQEKVIEEIGEKKEREVRDKIAKDQVNKHPVKQPEVIVTDRGNTLCFEKLSGRYFYSDIEKLRQAVNELNRQMRYDMYISLNEFYYAIGLEGSEVGDLLGWNIDKGYIDLDFSSQLTPDGKPWLVVSYTQLPQYEYN